MTYEADVIDAASTILQNTTRLSGVIPRSDVCPVTFYFQRVWDFLTSFQALSLPVEFALFSGHLFSVCPVFSVLTGPSPKVVRLA